MKLNLTGQEVCTIEATPQYPRHTEGAFALLNDGTIMYAYTRFYGGSNDESGAEIYALFSHDDGNSWGEGRTLFSKNEEDANIMSVSFLRMQDGSLGMFFLRKTGEGKTMNCIPYLTRSYDEGVTWSEAIRCIDTDGYFVMNNDRVIRLKSGRVILPLAYHYECDMWGVGCFFISDDDCKTFREAAQRLELPFKHNFSGLQEPGVCQLKDSRVWMWARTAHGYQFEAYSDDEGETWSDVMPNEFFTSPLSPMGAKWLNNGKLLAVFNPIPVFNGRYSVEGAPSPHAMSTNTNRGMYHPFTAIGGRTPLTCAISDDGPKEFKPQLYNLENNPDLGFCYPAIFSNKDYALIAYFYGYYKNGKAYYNGRIKKLKLKDICENQKKTK